MKNSKLPDLYSDYLIGAFGQTTATGLPSLLDGEVSHDQIQRFLAGVAQNFTACRVEWRVKDYDWRGRALICVADNRVSLSDPLRWLTESRELCRWLIDSARESASLKFDI